jgi:hypothetical protein
MAESDFWPPPDISMHVYMKSYALSANSTRSRSSNISLIDHLSNTTPDALLTTPRTSRLYATGSFLNNSFNIRWPSLGFHLGNLIVECVHCDARPDRVHISHAIPKLTTLKIFFSSSSLYQLFASLGVERNNTTNFSIPKHGAITFLNSDGFEYAASSMIA